MATQAIRFFNYVPSYLSRYFYVCENKNKDLVLRLDANHIFYESAEMREKFQRDESILDMLEAVESYENASFFKRWHLRLSTPIRAEQYKLSLASEYVKQIQQENSIFTPSPLLDRLMNRLPLNKNSLHKNPPVGVIFSYISEVKNIWQGILSFMRNTLSSLSPFPKKYTYTAEVDARAKESKRHLHALYAEAIVNVEEKYFKNPASQRGKRSVDDILRDVEKQVTLCKKRLCEPFSLFYHWVGGPALSDEDAQQKIALLNQDFDWLEMKGQEAFKQAKAKIYLCEALRESLVALRKSTKSTLKNILKMNMSWEMKIEALSHEREKAASRCRHHILFSVDSRVLQRQQGVSPQMLLEFFSQDSLELDRFFHRPFKVLEKKRQAEKPSKFEQDIYTQYQNFLRMRLNILLEDNSERVKPIQSDIRNEYKQFLKAIDEKAIGLHPEYPAQSLSLWNARMKEADEAVNQWRMLLRKHAHYENFLNHLKAFSAFLGFSPNSVHYRFLAEAHAQGLRKLLLRCENVHLINLSDRAENLIVTFNERLKECQIELETQFPLSGLDVVSAQARDYAALSAELYQHYCFQVGQALLNHAALDESALEMITNQIDEMLSDVVENSSQLQECRQFFEENIRTYKAFINRIFSEIKGGLDLSSQNAHVDLSQFKILSQKTLFNGVRELQSAKKLAEEKSISVKSILEQLVIDGMNHYFPSALEKNAPLSYCVSLKTQLNHYIQEKLTPQLEKILPEFGHIFSRLQMLSVENLRCALKEGELFSNEAFFSRESLLDWINERDYFNNQFQAFHENLNEQLDESRLSLEEEAPDLKGFIARYLNLVKAEIEKIQSDQHDLLIAYQKNPPTFVSLEERSELAIWIHQAIRDYTRGMAWDLIQHLNENPSAGSEYARQQRPVKQHSLAHALYARLSHESTKVQLQGMLYVERAWNTDNRLDRDRDFDLMVRVWRVLQEGELWLDSAEWLKENEACLHLLSDLLQKQSDFWKQDQREDVDTFKRLIRWQKNCYNRLLKVGDHSAKEDLQGIQKRVKKILQSFLLIYHPDKRPGDEGWKVFYGSTGLALKQEADSLLSLCDQPMDVHKPQKGFVDPLEAKMAEFLQNVAGEMAGKFELSELERRVTRQEQELSELDRRVTRQEQELSELERRVTRREQELSELDGRVTKQEQTLIVLEGISDRQDATLSTQKEQILECTEQVKALRAGVLLAKQKEEQKMRDKSLQKSGIVFEGSETSEKSSEESDDTSEEEAYAVSAVGKDEIFPVAEPKPISPSISANGSSPHQPNFFQTARSSTPPPKEPSPTLSSASENTSPRH